MEQSITTARGGGMTASLEGNDVTVNLLLHALVAILRTCGFALH